MGAVWSAFFAGDFYLHERAPEPFMTPELAEFVRSHELRCLNFEGVVPTPGAKPIAKVGPHMVQAPEGLEWVRRSFNAVCLANNHAYDLGDEGLKNTLQSLSGLLTVGAGMSEVEAYALRTFHAAGVKVGLLAFAEAQFGALAGNERRGGYAWVNHPSVNQRVAAAKREVDLLIVQVHAGVEHVDVPLPEWRVRYRELIECGADGLIGHHPHVSQGWELYRDRPIVYSCGNFFFPLHETGSGYGVSLTFNGARFENLRIVPLRLTGGRVGMREDDAANREMVRLCDLLSPLRYDRYVDATIGTLWSQRYEPTFRRALGGVRGRTFLRDTARAFLKPQRERDLLLIDTIQNETNRWVVQRALAAASPRA